MKRTWPIASDAETLKRPWCGLLNAKDRALAFRETSDREVNGTYQVSLTDNPDSTQIAKFPSNEPMPQAQRYAYRSFDRHFVIADGRLMSRPRPDLWRTQSERQVYLTSLLNHPLGQGPAATACALIPDLHHFRGSYGAKEVIPLYRTADAKEANILPGLLSLLANAFNRPVSPEDFLAYVYGVLAQPAFTARFQKELETRELRVPITKDAALFEQARSLGAHLLWLHCYGERFIPEGKARGHIPAGKGKMYAGHSGDALGYPEAFTYNDATQTLQGRPRGLSAREP